MDSQKANKIINNIKTLKALMNFRERTKEENNNLKQLLEEVNTDLQGFRYFSYKVNPCKMIESFVEYCRQNNITDYESHHEHVEQLYSDVLFYLDDFVEGNAQTYYHVIIETSEVTKTGGNKEYFELDKTVDITEIESRIVSPYLKKQSIHFDGYFIESKDIKRVLVVETLKPTKELLEYERHFNRKKFLFLNNKGILNNRKHTTNITTAVFDRVKTSLDNKSMTTNNPKKIDLSKIFIVHGRDNELKQEVARFIENLGFEAIILHEQANKGQTIIQKFEANSDVGYAIILYTPCDDGRLVGQQELKPRARQNVVFEHGYLMAKLGADKVTLLRKGDVEMPSDIQGLTYHDIDGGTWKIKVALELKGAEYDVDMNKLF